jgi:membrane fusion protein, multidrug efflux system
MRIEALARSWTAISNAKIKIKIWLAAGTAGLVVAPCLIFFHVGRGKAVVVVEAAERREVPIVVELPAQTEAAATVEIRANVEGRLTEMSFSEGNMVKKGQVLFRIDPRRCAAALQLADAAVEKAEGDLEMAQEQEHLVNAQSALRQAEAKLLGANQDAERMKPLAARRAVPERDLDAAIAAQSSALAAVEDARATVRNTTVGDRVGLRQAQASLAAAKAARKNAELDFEETTIRAPIGGLIGRTDVSVGNYVRPGQLKLATITPLDPINVGFRISETLYLFTITKGVDREAMAHLELILSDNSTYPFRGRYTNLARAMDAKTGTILIGAQFPNPKGILVPGMSGRIRMPVETKSAVLVSERAVFEVQGFKSVNIVTPENRVALRHVETAGSYEGKSIVTQGLSAGEAVIVEGMMKVRPGQRVTIKTRQGGRGG